LKNKNWFVKKQQKDIPISPHPIVEISTESITVSVNSMVFVAYILFIQDIFYVAYTYITSVKRVDRC